MRVFLVVGSLFLMGISNTACNVFVDGTFADVPFSPAGAGFALVDHTIFVEQNGIVRPVVVEENERTASIFLTGARASIRDDWRFLDPLVSADMQKEMALRDGVLIEQIPIQLARSHTLRLDLDAENGRINTTGARIVTESPLNTELPDTQGGEDAVLSETEQTLLASVRASMAVALPDTNLLRGRSLAEKTSIDIRLLEPPNDAPPEWLEAKLIITRERSADDAEDACTGSINIRLNSQIVEPLAESNYGFAAPIVHCAALLGPEASGDCAVPR